ncbi:hypothetical protein L3Q82_003837 [Scortum barcoo]|uniref:Uncharacterized protein n=1 Tax=Scortum barcoo TaxID=214431 RepID=A0ACB8X5C9_9TELE|nr:hypothetical protein L3Q82_003837 [Scortum barcoo]
MATLVLTFLAEFFITMETSPNVIKRRKNVAQSECQNQGEVGLADTDTDPNANGWAEPNFNLNLNLTLPRTPHPATETSKLHGGNKKDNGNKGGGKPGAKGPVIMEAGKSASTLATPVMSPRERHDPSRQKSKIPALSRSQTAEVSVNRGGEQRLKSPNVKHTPTLSPRIHNMAASPKPQRVEQTLIASSPGTNESVKAQVLRTESASFSNLNPHVALTTELTTKTTNKMKVSLKMQTNKKEESGKEISPPTQSPKPLHLPLKGHNHKGDSNGVSPKLANRTPTVTAKVQKPGPATTITKSNEQTRHDSRTPPVGTKVLNQRTEMTLLNTKTPQPSSLSPKPSTQRKAAVIKNTNSSGSKENLDGKDSSGSKSGSNSKAMTVTKDSLDKTGSDSRGGPNTKTTVGSKDSLDSKSSSASKTSLGSKDSLDSKTASNSKASPSPESEMDSRDNFDSKTTNKIKGTKPRLDFKSVTSSKCGMGSKKNPDPKTETPSDSEGLSFKPGSNSEVLSSSNGGLTHLTSKPSLVASGSKIDRVGSDSPSSSRTGLCGTKDKNLKAASLSAKPSIDAEAGSDSSKPGAVWSNSKSALSELSSSTTLSPRQSPASRGPGSGPGKSIGSDPRGSNRDVQRSPGISPGNYTNRV